MDDLLAQAIMAIINVFYLASRRLFLRTLLGHVVVKAIIHTHFHLHRPRDREIDGERETVVATNLELPTLFADYDIRPLGILQAIELPMLDAQRPISRFEDLKASMSSGKLFIFWPIPDIAIKTSHIPILILLHIPRFPRIEKTGLLGAFLNSFPLI